MISGKLILSSSPKLEVSDPGGTSDSCYGTQNEHKNTQNHVIEGEIRRDITVETDK